MTSAKIPAIDADALVIGCAQTADGAKLITDGLEGLDAATVQRLEVLAKQLGITGKPDAVYKYPTPRDLRARLLVLTGLGEPKPDGTFTPEALRRAAGAAMRSLSGSQSAAIALPTPDEASLTAVVEGAFLGDYAFTKYKTGPDQKTPVADIQVVTALKRSERAKDAFYRAEIIAKAVGRARDLVDTPPNVLYPGSFAEIARSTVKELTGNKVKVNILSEKQLQAGGYGGIVGVGQGSSRPPCLVVLSYSPPNARAHVGLVGKGITFDSGGLNLKTTEKFIHLMSLDMAGAATVLETVIVAAQLNLPVAVTGYLCLAENMPGGHAQRPGDVVTMRDGTTVEIFNTDAEGRLVMGDGIADAVAAGCDPIIDVATLTGASKIAFGMRTGAVMGTPSVRDAVVAAAADAGEQLWPMPLPEELDPSGKSVIADLVNATSVKAGGMLFAAKFLAHFYGDANWAHIDMAGPAYNGDNGWGYTPKGGTGFGVRTLVTLLEDIAATSDGVG